LSGEFVHEGVPKKEEESREFCFGNGWTEGWGLPASANTLTVAVACDGDANVSLMGNLRPNGGSWSAPCQVDWIGGICYPPRLLVEALRWYVMQVSKLYADDKPVPVLAPWDGQDGRPGKERLKGVPRKNHWWQVTDSDVDVFWCIPRCLSMNFLFGELRSLAMSRQKSQD
jgi:hypothetical protein